MGLCQRIKVDRVFYDQRFLLEDVAVEVDRVIPVPEGATAVTDVVVDIAVTECDLDLENDTIDIEFFIVKTITFDTGDELEFSFNRLVSDVPLPKLQDTTIPPEYLPRLKCQIFDFTPVEELTFNPATETITDTLSIELTIKIAAEDQIVVSLCPKELTRTITGTVTNVTPI